MRRMSAWPFMLSMLILLSGCGLSPTTAATTAVTTAPPTPAEQLSAQWDAFFAQGGGDQAIREDLDVRAKYFYSATQYVSASESVHAVIDGGTDSFHQWSDDPNEFTMVRRSGRGYVFTTTDGFGRAYTTYEERLPEEYRRAGLLSVLQVTELDALGLSMSTDHGFDLVLDFEDGLPEGLSQRTRELFEYLFYDGADYDGVYEFDIDFLEGGTVLDLDIHITGIDPGIIMYDRLEASISIQAYPCGPYDPPDLTEPWVLFEMSERAADLTHVADWSDEVLVKTSDFGPAYVAVRFDAGFYRYDSERIAIDAIHGADAAGIPLEATGGVFVVPADGIYHFLIPDDRNASFTFAKLDYETIEGPGQAVELAYGLNGPFVHEGVDDVKHFRVPAAGPGVHVAKIAVLDGNVGMRLLDDDPAASDVPCDYGTRTFCDAATREIVYRADGDGAATYTIEILFVPIPEHLTAWETLPEMTASMPSTPYLVHGENGDCRFRLTIATAGRYRFIGTTALWRIETREGVVVRASTETSVFWTLSAGDYVVVFLPPSDPPAFDFVKPYCFLQ